MIEGLSEDGNHPVQIAWLDRDHGLVPGRADSSQPD
jgi:hypothetical protein